MFKNIVLKYDIQNFNCPYQRLLMKPGILFTNKVTKKALIGFAGDSVLDDHLTLPLVLRGGPKHWILSVDDGDLLLAGRKGHSPPTMKSHAVLHKLLWRIANLI